MKAFAAPPKLCINISFLLKKSNKVGFVTTPDEIVDLILDIGIIKSRRRSTFSNGQVKTVKSSSYECREYLESEP